MNWYRHSSDEPDPFEEHRQKMARQEEARMQEIEHQRQLYLDDLMMKAMLEEHCKELISLIGGIIYKLMSYKDTFEAWLATKPKEVQELAKKYPPGDYKIKEDAPVKVTKPGSTVLLISYLETGQIGVMIKGEDKSDDAIEHETMLCERYKKSKEELEKIHKQDVTVNVDPEWLELVTNELD
jgi:hypothetical protein